MGAWLSRPDKANTAPGPGDTLNRKPNGHKRARNAEQPKPNCKRTRTERPEAEEDIRGTRVPDVQVKPEYFLRVARQEDGSLKILTGDRPLYSPGFLDSLVAPAPVNACKPPTRDEVRSARGSGELDRRPPPDGSLSARFLGHGLRRALRKREVAFPRSDAVLPAIMRADGVVGSFGEAEKRRIDLKGKLYLAPLTTVGNLPFRRMCKRLGADITCGEMAKATQLLKGDNSEWALMRRHESEDVFGVQIAGSHVDAVAHAAEVVARECPIDFLEINAGCPIDSVFNKGAGCALMARRTKLCRMVSAVASVTDIPVGVKIRTGVNTSCPTAHITVPALALAGASWVTVHGRSRKQRYSKRADWAYIAGDCASAALRARIPLLGNGDVYNWEDYFRATDATDTAMLARGALIKPWLLTEIKERRHWDIRGSERLELVKELAGYGLDHWGADARGVETARRFMLDWLSFAYRYVPVGLQETEPAGLAARAPFFRGRDDMETLMGSQDCRDWVRITEMVLGKAPAGFRFSPRHKSNAWG